MKFEVTFNPKNKLIRLMGHSTNRNYHFDPEMIFFGKRNVLYSNQVYGGNDHFSTILSQRMILPRYIAFDLFSNRSYAERFPCVDRFSTDSIEWPNEFMDKRALFTSVNNTFMRSRCFVVKQKTLYGAKELLVYRHILYFRGARRSAFRKENKTVTEIGHIQMSYFHCGDIENAYEMFKRNNDKAPGAAVIKSMIEYFISDECFETDNVNFSFVVPPQVLRPYPAR